MFQSTEGHFQLKMWDVRRFIQLPTDWVAQIDAVVNSSSIICKLDGKASTSREPMGSPPISLPIVTGDTIKRQLGWLYEAYAGPLRILSQELFNRELAVSNDLVNSININAVTGTGSRYERHVDSNPVTGILYASTLREEDGGALCFDHEEGSVCLCDLVYPRAGLFIAFDARKTPHYVSPLKSNKRRLSIPMNYYLAGEPQTRPEDLDSYLYVSK